jgi:shikimate dehydrogenase
MVAPQRTGGAVLGSPVAHSLSPVLHRAAYEALGLADWSYRAVECTEADLPATLRRLADEGLAGVSLTMPLKRAVMAMLAGIDPWAAGVGAANTVLFGTEDGGWRGANTDVPGLVEVLRTAGFGITTSGAAGPHGTPSDGAPPERAPWILGAGATGCSALAALAAIGCPEAVVAARRPGAVAGDVQAVAGRLGIAVEVRPWSELAGALAAPVALATTPAGATDAIAADLSAERRSLSGVLLDVVYSPWPTALAAAWLAAGGRVVGGIELLVEQALGQVRLMTGLTPPAEPVRRAGYAALESR